MRCKRTPRIVMSLLSVLLLASLLFSSAPTSTAVARSSASTQSRSTQGGATFDLYSMFPYQPLSPLTGNVKTFMPLETREISGSGEVTLSASSQSGHFKATIDPSKVTPQKDAPAKSRVYVECDKGTPDGEVGWIKVTGKRGGESHRIWLKATTAASSPQIKLSRGAPFSGQGYYDQTLQVFTGKPVVWHVAVTNDGGAGDTYALSYKASFPCKVIYRNLGKKTVKEVTLPGVTKNLLFAKPAELTAEVSPVGEFPTRAPQDVTLVVGPGKRGAKAAELKVQVMNPGLVYNADDLSGSKPHPHQVMPGETTSFMFHCTNSGKTQQTVTLAVSAAPAGVAAAWGVKADRGSVTLKPGESKPVTVSVTAPGSAAVGDRLELTATASDGSGRTDTAKVAAEVTDVRNVYYWSVDSMDPEYLYLDSKGTGTGKDGDRLMPNMWTFLKQSANYTDAKCYLPSATDMNHTNALAGTYSGTAGVYMVGGTYHGFTDHDEALAGPNDLAYARYGPDGTPIQRTFEVSKQQTGGKSFCGFWSNKNWLAEFEAKNIDIYGHSEHWPLFFQPPWKYKSAGDPVTDKNASEDPVSASAKCVFHSNNANAVMIPTILGQFDLINGLRLLSTPLSIIFGKTPGMHAEDRYIADSMFRTIKEQDPDVAYINIGDLDNTGHFTGAGYPRDEWKKGKNSPADDQNIYSPWLRREDTIDIAREADTLFGEFVGLLKARGVYDNSVIVFLSDHGMENMKDPKKGYQVIDLRAILRDNGFLRHEDYEETGGTEINVLWSKNPSKTAAMKKALADYTVSDPKLGKVKPLTVLDRDQMKNGADFGKAGHVRPGEIWSEYWAAHPNEGDNGEQWPDIFVAPLYNYQVVGHGDVLSSGVNAIGFSLNSHLPESVLFGLPGAHGGLQTDHIPLMVKAPSGYAKYSPGSEYTSEVEIGDIAPTIYGIMGWPVPGCVDGQTLP